MIDISLNDDLFITDKVDAAVQELDMLFNTEQTELIGCTDYGTNWWSYLWELTPLVDDIKAYITQKISETYFASQYITVIDVQFVQGTERAIYYIKITLQTPDGEEVATQQYELT